MNIQTTRGLGWLLHVPAEELESLAHTAGGYYNPVLVTKRGKTRLITAPTGLLRDIQGRIYAELLRPLDLPDELHGGVPGKSPLTNAQQHLGQPCVVAVDIKSFFPSITHTQVNRVWRALKVAPTPARPLTKLTTFRGCLPQGAPTSSSLANLVLLGADSRLRTLTQNAGVRYTRYVDDLVFSGSNPRHLISASAHILAELGFRLSRRKIRVMSQRRLQEVTGYSVNTRRGPSVPRFKRDRVRAAIYQLQQLVVGTEARADAVESLTGRINHVRLTNSGNAKRLRKQMGTVLAG